MKSLSLILVLLLCIVGIADSDDSSADNDSSGSSKYNVFGIVTENETGVPIKDATVQIPSHHIAMPTNADGRYRLVLEKGEYLIKVSHIGHYSDTFTVSVIDSSVTADIGLRSLVIDLGVRTVRTSDYNPADKIIEAAIARKKDILGQFQDYVYDSHAKFVVHDAQKADSESIKFIIESQTTSYWQNPDKYKEIIRARKQSANLAAAEPILVVGEMLNFNRNRLELGDYSVVTPTARDARDHYIYRLIDTVYYDERPAYVLEFTPKNEYAPLMEGEVHILDSTYEVARIDGRFTKGVSFTGLENLGYYQQLAAIAGEYWLPMQISLTADVKLNFPGLPSHMTLEFIAVIYSYQINRGIPDGIFDEYVIEVDKSADEIDSLGWEALAKVPLTEQEINGYKRIDSLESNKPLWKKLMPGLLIPILLLTEKGHDYFHYNRVEGPYAGLGLNLRKLLPDTEFHLRGGYAFNDYNWQYRLGIRHYLWDKQKLWVSGHFKDEIIHRPAIISGDDANATFYALFLKEDPFDYYREKGFELEAGFRFFRRLNIKGGYHDFDQFAKEKELDYSVFYNDETARDNVAITNGTMRSIDGSLVFDSRKILKSGRNESYAFYNQFTRLEFGGEYASPNLIDNDFYFKKYFIELQGHYRLPELGALELFGYAGASTEILPPQRLFIIDYLVPYMSKRRGMLTAGENNFGGDRVALFYGRLDLGPYIFRNSGLKYLKKIPFNLTLHGGLMLADFHNSPVDSSLRVAKTPYTEIGFGFGNLMPFIAPFNLSLEFTWQLSAYDTNRFSFGFDFGM